MPLFSGKAGGFVPPHHHQPEPVAQEEAPVAEGPLQAGGLAIDGPPLLPEEVALGKEDEDPFPGAAGPPPCRKASSAAWLTRT
jgi:hypothetical protein